MAALAGGAARRWRALGPHFAEAGGKDPSKIGEMLAAARGIIEKILSA